MATLERKLSLEQKELVAVGAGVGVGCHPCVDHHLKAGAKAGLDGERLLAALTSAEHVAAAAAALIGDHVRQENAARIHLRQAERLLDALEAVAVPEDEAEPGDGCGRGADEENKPPVPSAEAADRPPVAAPLGDDDTGTNRRTVPAACCNDWMAELFATAGSGEMTGIPAAMANCRHMSEHACSEPATPTDTNDPPTATEAAGPCRKES